MSAPLPNVSSAAREHGVTLWGAPGAGKSGLLGALYAASLRPDADGWSAHPKDAEDEYARERLKDAYLGLRGRTNTKTGLPAIGAEYPPLRVVLRRLRGKRPTAALRVALVDPAGEFSTQLELAHTREGKLLFARIARGGGVVWLIEAGQRPDDVAARMLVLQHLVALLEQSGGRQLGIPVALCLSKTDCLTAADRAAAHADPAAALRAHLGETAFTWFEAVCPTMRCFAITSTGVVDGRVQPEGLEPLFDWLAGEAQPAPTLRDRLGAVARVVRPVIRDRIAPTLGTLVRRAAQAVIDRPGVRRVVIATAVVAGGAVAVRVIPSAAPALGRMIVRPLRALQSLPSRRESAGEVSPPPAPDVRPKTTSSRPASVTPTRGKRAPMALGVADAERRFARALDAARSRDWSQALESLGDGVPPDALRMSWDSLFVVVASAASAQVADAAQALQLREAVRARATDALRRGPAGSRQLAALRLARAIACLDGALDCSRADVVADLTWAMLGPASLRHEARRRLAALDGGTP